MTRVIDTARRYAGPILIGGAVALAGILPWTLIAPINARVRPDLPWAALAMLAYLALYVAWLNGAGWPRKWRNWRHESLRLWRPGPSIWTRAGLGPTLGLLAMLTMLYVLWITLDSQRPPPDLSLYPTTAYRVSVVLIGALVSGLVEEMAFRGYMQSRLERYGPGTAIIATSLIFTLFHGVHGGAALLLLGPGLFIASALYGMLAYHTGSIVPGIVIHSLGDLSYTFFATLGGDARLLFAG